MRRSVVERIAEAVAALVVARLAAVPRRRSARTHRSPSLPWPQQEAFGSFPPQTQFASRTEWLAWCERDRESEMLESLAEHTVSEWDADAFERIHTAPAPVIPLRPCAACLHQHGGRAYGLCLVPGCDCIAVRSVA